MPEILTLPRWYDLHVHVRQGQPMASYTKAHADMGCAGILAMPNTKPPVAKIFKEDGLPYWSIEEYRAMIEAASEGAFSQIITPLYLTADTTPAMIEAGAKAGILKACKYYPPHGTTNADFGSPLQGYVDNGVFEAMSDNNVILCVHGEEHGLTGEAYFGKNGNAEDHFYKERITRVRDAMPDLRISCEHVTTKTAVDFVKASGPNTGATITPQHLLFTVADLLQGLKYHLYCLPLVKFEEDRRALLAAVNDPENSQFYAGTDSAPHTTKCTECGCAAGCYTGGIAPQLYIKAFDLTNGSATFENFLCRNGANFYELPVPSETFTMVRKTETKHIASFDTGEGRVVPLTEGLNITLDWSIE
jgi:dihydroorotase